jgi:hypothetical protein
MTSPGEAGVVQHVEPDVAGLTINPGHLWMPVVGEELTELLERSSLDEDGRDLVRRQAVAVLGHTLDPTAGGAARRTGLIVGYVQSGKTLSFTSVMALAHDNGVRLVILFSGTKDNLHRQTHSRLQRDLRSVRSGGGPWLLYENALPGSPAAGEIRTVLSSPRTVGASANPLLQAFRLENRTVVITVMKNSTRLANTRRLIEELVSTGVDFESLPVLVVDDEADQAGLNTRAGEEDDPSATFAAIRDLREALPRHSYLQYTATPQAPLLLDLVNTLSPDFVGVLMPGVGYTGGKYFFRDHVDQFIRVIPSAEAQTALDEDLSPPESLKAALASYLVASLLMGTRGVSQSSMLVHPSHTQDQHDKFARWVRALKATWMELLDQPAGDEMRVRLIEEYIQPACEDLAPSSQLLADPESVSQGVRFVLANMQVRVVNSAELSDADIEWDRFPFWILVGGNKLDRGYTVEGLVTTYMPRGQGGGQADTIQQRARFFGYKGAYGDLCRAWLVPETAHIYQRYVEHEEALRTELTAVAQSGTSLKEWRRRLLIDAALRPCRANVIGLPYVRQRVKGDSWTRYERLVIPVGSVERNRDALDQFLAPLVGISTPHPSDPREERVNRLVTVDLSTLIEELLTGWLMDDLDESTMGTTLLLLRSRLDEQPDLVAEMVLMDGLERRERSLAEGHLTKINNLFQGRSPQGAVRYPGDLAFRSEDPLRVSIQIHRVDVRRDQDSPPFLTDVPAVALWVPRRLASDLILGVV